MVSKGSFLWNRLVFDAMSFVTDRKLYENYMFQLPFSQSIWHETT